MNTELEDMSYDELINLWANLIILHERTKTMCEELGIEVSE